jgi:hypothetical protein
MLTLIEIISIERQKENNARRNSVKRTYKTESLREKKN